MLALYCLYAAVGQYLIWLHQPRFVSAATGKLAWSTGFVIQLCIFAGLFLLLTAVEIILLIKFFRRPKTKKA